MGENLGALLGNVEAVEFYEYPGKNRIIKLKVAINVHEHIQTGIHVGNLIDGTTWIDFRYEKLPQICYNCGIIGHAANLCQNPPLNVSNTTPLGPWIRSTQYGIRVMEAKDKKYYSNPSQAKDFGHTSPPAPDSLIQQFAAMKLHHTTPMDSPNEHQQTRFHTNIQHHSMTKAIQGFSMDMTMVESSVGGSSCNTAKRQRTDDSTVNQTDMAGPAKQASQQP